MFRKAKNWLSSKQSEIIHLSLADQECFAQALLLPPVPVPALERAFTRRRKLLEQPAGSPVVENKMGR